LDLNLRKKLLKCYIRSIAIYGAGNSTFQTVDRNFLKTFQIWCWRSMQKISWTERVINGEVLKGVKDERNIVQATKRRKSWSHFV
jgi:hypothetical protein